MAMHLRIGKDLKGKVILACGGTGKNSTMQYAYVTCTKCKKLGEKK